MEKPWLAHYEEGTPAEVDIPNYPITQDLLENAARYPHHPALIYGSVVEPLGNLLLDRKMSFRQLCDLTTRFAAGLQELGVKKGDRVVIHLPNCPQFVIATYATLMIGAIAVPSNPEYVARELKYQLNDSGAETTITLSLTYPTVKQIRAETPLKRVVVTNVKEYFPRLLKVLFTTFKEKKEGHYQDIADDADTTWFQDILKSALPHPSPVEINMGDTAVLMYTGGTTGTIKGAQLTHRNLQANAVQIRYWFPRLNEGEEMILAALPFYHSYGMTTCMNLGIRTCTTNVLIVNPRVTAHILKSIEKHGAGFYPGVPAFYIAAINHPNINKYRLKSIKACISGAASLPEEVQRKFEAITGGRLVEGYGLSEATPVTHANPIFGERRNGTIGLPLPSTEAKIVDIETGAHELEPGEVGELVVRGPQVMRGYWKKSIETAYALRNGWLYTGDIARMDEDGYFRIVDRKKDVIVGTSGLNIYPSEVEKVLRQHPKIRKCAAIGVPAGIEKGERVKVFIVLEEDETATEDEIRAFCRENLTPYKIPKFIEFRDELPVTPFGKILRRVLLEEEMANQP
ncbi:MAG: long-chain fatty acid--CoA ligase [Anaerolineae bacterium]|nr:long-chain fatty acid--CoA ligase [Anaerolineae bacterium]